MEDNKKPRYDVSSLATDTSEQGSIIPMDSNANHRARITRFSQLRQQSKDMSNWLYTKYDECISSGVPASDLMAVRLKHFADNLRFCGSRLLFKHYYTLDEYRLAHMQSCKRHMLCPFCSAIRASKQANAYHSKLVHLLKEYPNLKPVFITLTVKNGDDLRERFKHLMTSFKTMQTARRKWLKRGTGHNELCKAHGIVYSAEITHKGNGWHPHLHMIALVDDWIDREKLSLEWERITGDSKIIDVRRIKPAKLEQDDYSKAFVECFKYAMKFTDMTHYQIWLAHETLSPNQRLMRLTGSVGLFRGVKVPEQLTDDEIADNSPFMAILYQFLNGSYTVVETLDFPNGQPLKKNLSKTLDDYFRSGEVLPKYIISKDKETGEVIKTLDSD